MRIGICDDDERQRKHLHELCSEYGKENGIDCEIVEFKTGREVLNYQREVLTLLLLDIEMAGINGIEVMKTIESSDMVWRIVFVSSHTEAVWSTFGLKTLDFGRKPIKYEEIEKWINVAICEFDDEIVIKFEKDNRDTWRTIGEIIYLEAEGNYVIVHDKRKEFMVTKSLKYWQDKLPEKRMVRVHKSYIVNLDYVKSVTDKITLKYREEILPIGRAFRKDLVNQYKKYVMERIKKRLC